MKHNIIDTSLRDGEQAPGVAFAAHEKMRVAELLDQLNIDEVELGTPAMGKAEISAMRSIANQGFNYDTSCWCRALKKDIDMAIQCNTTSINISFPISEIQLKAIGKDRAWVEAELPKIVAYAANHFSKITIGAQDASRADSEFLETYIDMAQDAGATRVRIADTVGIMTPLSTQAMFQKLHKRFRDFDLEFHPHNDLGMATANAYTALHAGARSVSGTINGLGERAGNCAIEELITALTLEGSTKYNTQMIAKACAFVEQISKRKLHCSKPIVGRKVFTHESGIHVRSILKDKMSYQPFDESLVGITNHEIVIGKHSGQAAKEYIKTESLTHQNKDCDWSKTKVACRKNKFHSIKLQQPYTLLTLNP